METAEAGLTAGGGAGSAGWLQNAASHAGDAITGKRTRSQRPPSALVSVRGAVSGKPGSSGATTGRASVGTTVTGVNGMPAVTSRACSASMWPWSTGKAT